MSHVSAWADEARDYGGETLPPRRYSSAQRPRPTALVKRHRERSSLSPIKSSSWTRLIERPLVPNALVGVG